MPRAEKLIAHHRHGQGKLSAHRMSVLRTGPLGDIGAGYAADMFVDPMPYLSLKGVNVDREYDRRGNVMRATDESHIQKRTRGKHGGRAPDGRHHHGGGKLTTKE